MRKDIEAVIQTYFDSMYESDPDKVHAAFHPNAKIVGYIQGDFMESTVGQFADLVAGHQPSEQSQGLPARLEIVSCEMAGDTAIARVRDDYMGLTFLDTLSLINTDDGWLIYNKLFHVEGPAG